MYKSIFRRRCRQAQAPEAKGVRQHCESATRDKAKDKEPRPASSYLPVWQEQPFDPDSEGASATIASVRKHPQQLTNYRPMIAHYRIDTRNGNWNMHQQANGDEVQFSALAFKCHADKNLAGSQPPALARPQAFPKIRC
jgi:hypothetical protein